MKKLSKIIVLLSLLIIALTTTVFAETKEYVVTKDLIYQNNRRSTLVSGFIEVLIGNKNFTQYQEDNDIKITPLPDEIREDEYGNLYAYFDVSRVISGTEI